MLEGLPRPVNAAVLVGTETSDDAGVVRLPCDGEAGAGLALVTTADFITPVLDDPWLFGQIAAANSLSDVYAMGGRPLAAIALCMFPAQLPPEAAREILAGGQAKVVEAGAALVGGHTVKSDELLYGLSVTGTVRTDRIVRNVGVRPGDALVLTKPLGSGLVINGLRKGAIDEARAREVLVELAVLNRAAAEVVDRFHGDVHAMTDVTGFGLFGHAGQMALGSGVALRFQRDALPIYPHVREMVEAGVTTGSTRPNREAVAPLCAGAPLDRFDDQLVHDPQTSGGLLVALDPARADAFVHALAEAGVTHARIVGQALAGPPALALT